MLLLSTSSLKGYGLHKIFTFVKKSGYDGIDLVIENSNFDTWDTDYISSLSKAFEVPVLSITAPEKNMTEEKVRKIASMAKTLNSQLITFAPPHKTTKNTDWFRGLLPKIKKDLGISIAIQNILPSFMFFFIPEYKVSSLQEIKAVTGDSTLNINNLDKNSGIDLKKATSILGKTIKNIAFADKVGFRDGILPGTAGGGTSYLPLESFLMNLKINGYNGFISLTVKPKELGVGNEERVMKNLEYLKGYYEKHFLNYRAT